MKKYLIPLLALIALYATFRVGGLDIPYYQDELDWVVGILGHTQLDPHPPFSSLIYFVGKALVGQTHLRLVPFVFGAVNLLLLWAIVKRRVGIRAAYITAALFAISFASVLGSLIIDVDGQWLPFLFLLTLFALDRYRDASIQGEKRIWAILGTTIVIVGLLTKLSFVVAVGALGIEFLILNRIRWKALSFWITYAGYWLAVLLLVAMGMYFGRLLTQSYSGSLVFSYTLTFITLHRSWLQITIQVVKTLLYLSPMLVLPSFFLRRARLIALRPFILFLGFALFFYVVLFDFSRGALDRYLLILIVPLCAIAGAAIADVYSHIRFDSRALIIVLVAGAGLIALQLIPVAVVPQYPKEEWFRSVVTGHWTFLMPFTGGSGPLGFYVSWLSVGFAWTAAVLAALFVFFRHKGHMVAITIIIGVSVAYCVLFVEEYQFGLFNGSAQQLLEQAMIYIGRTPSITKVITYNDIGSFELQRLGKYERRLYAAPKFAASYTDILRAFRGHYLVIDIPALAADNRYVKFWQQCPIVFSERDGAITSTIYDCRESISVP
ncbi:MAG TPA: glycosyltransferase family 39 protein [Candidatus Paceibacterota bacterium]|nr:glycosyltransferase family 39 protein [Candidatus Paceibacterota bacterium]